MISNLNTAQQSQVSVEEKGIQCEKWKKQTKNDNHGTCTSPMACLWEGKFPKLRKLIPGKRCSSLFDETLEAQKQR